MTKSVRPSSKMLNRFRRSRWLAFLTLVTTQLSLLTSLVPREVLAQVAGNDSNPGNSPSSPGPGNTGISQGQTDLGLPETGPAAASGALATGSVDPSTGAFSASIPFETPAARGGVQPGLALVYASSGETGVGGLGWSLNLPSIERHNLSGSPQYMNDPAAGAPINVDAGASGTGPTQDRFTFGGQPLVPICVVGTGQSCAPDVAETTEPMPAWATGGWHYYRLETETGANLRFFWSPNHQTWVVQAPSGATMELGVPQDTPSDTGPIDTETSPALAGTPCYLSLPTDSNACASGFACGPPDPRSLTNTPDCAPAGPYIFRWNLSRQYDAQRIPSTTHPSNIIEYAWQKLPVTGGTSIISDLTDVYDTPKVGDTAPLPSSFAHHTHFNYASLGYPNSTRVERARHNPHYLTGVDVTSQIFAGGAPRQQVRRYVLSYAGVGHQVELQQVQMDGWCASGDPAEDQSTYLLPAEGTTPKCGVGATGNQWPPATTFSYSNADPTIHPTFVALPQTFNQRPPTPPAILDVNADGMPDIVDTAVSQTVWLNSPATLNAWTSEPLTLATTKLSATSAGMQPAQPNYVSGAVLNDTHVNGVWFDPNWTQSHLIASSSAGVQMATYSPRLVGGTSYDWGTPALSTAMGIFPQELQNCAPGALVESTGSQLIPVAAIDLCRYPWTYMGTDEPFTTLDINGDGLQDMVVSSIYGNTYAQALGQTSGGVAVYSGLSADYAFLDVRYSQRTQNGVVTPFSAGIPPGSLTSMASGGKTVCNNGLCEAAWATSIYDGLQDPTYESLPTFCVGPRKPTCVQWGAAGDYAHPIPMTPAPWGDCGAVLPGAFGQHDTFGDINGDGIPDFITLSNTSFSVSYGHGDGVFGSCVDGSTQCGCDAANPVTFSTAASGQWGVAWVPQNQTDDPKLNAQFHDVDGDGFDDAIMPAPDGFDVYFIVNNTGSESHVHVNAEAGFGWSQCVNCVVSGASGTVPVAHDSAYMFADMDGSGVDDVVIENVSGQMGYVNMLGGARPGLLIGIKTTGLLSTTITYADLPSLARQSQTAPGRWTHLSPQPLHVVTDVLTTDQTPGLSAPPVETSYKYTNPIYDGRDRAFVGFGAVEVVNVGSLTPTTHTKTTFYQGYCDDSSSTTPCPQTPDYLNHALRGLPILTEVYGDQSANSDESIGAALSTTHRTFAERQMYNGMDGRKVYRVDLAATDTYWYDNSSTVTRVTPTQLVDVTINGVAVTTETSFAISSTGTRHTSIAYNSDIWGMNVVEIDDGEVSTSGSPVDGMVQTASLSTLVAQDTTNNWIWRPQSLTIWGTDASGKALGSPEVRSYTYDAFGNPLTISTSLSGSLPMARTTPAPAPTGSPSNASVNQTVALATFVIDPKGTGNVTRLQQTGTQRCQDIQYDSAYAELPTAWLTYVSGNCTGTPLVRTASIYVGGFELPEEVQEVDGETSQTTYDALGRVKSYTRPDPTIPAMTETTPGITIDYGDTLSPRQVHTTVVNGASSQSYWSALDGYGRVTLKGSPGDTAAGDVSNLIVTGPYLWNEKGQVSQVTAPTFQTAWNPAVALATSASRFYQYDAFGRILTAQDLDGTRVLQRTYASLGMVDLDAAGGKTTTRLEGHGRTQSVVKQGPAASISKAAFFAYLPAGELASLLVSGSDASGTTYPQYVRWMMYDSLGRMVLNAEPSTTAGFYAPSSAVPPLPLPASLHAWMYAYNDAGQLVATTDARGCGKNITYDGAGRLKSEDYFGCTANHAAYTAPNTTTGAGAEVFYNYDARGRVSDVYDRAAHTSYGYDARSRVTSVRKNVVQEANGAPVAPIPTSGYAPHTFEQDFAYDDLDRLLGQTTGEETAVVDLNGASVPFGTTTSTSAVTLTYSQRGVVESVTGSYGALVKSAVYDADGLPHATTWGDVAGTKSTYGYDARRRLVNLTTSRTSPSLWTSPTSPYSPPPLSPTTTTQTILANYTYTLDAVGNPTSIVDGRRATEWPTTAQPVSRAAKFDDFNRLASVTYTYGGANSYASPTTATATLNPLPLQSATTRIGSEAFTYDPFGNRTATTDDMTSFFDRSLGTVTTGTSGGYGTNEVTGASLKGGYLNVTPLGSLQASYDVSGNLQRLNLQRLAACESSTGCDQVFDFQWDEIGQLSRARRYDFVSSQSCVQIGYTNVCTPNDPPASYEYPAALPTTTPGADVRFAYDARGNRVVRASSEGSAATATYTVDIFPSLRLADTTFGEESAGDYDRPAGVDQVSLVASSAVYGRVLYAPGDPATSADILSGQRVFLEMTDGLGSTTTIIDQATSELVERTTYSVYGRVESDYRPARWESFREAFKFTGKEDDQAFGLTYFGARYYSPYLGTWISPDPIAIHALGSDLNPYAYVHGRTLSATDPFGLDCVEGLGTTCSDGSVTPGVSPSLAQQFLNLFKGINISNPFKGGGPSAPGAQGNPGNANFPRTFFGGGGQSAEDAYQQTIAKFGPQAGGGNPLTDAIVSATPVAAAVTSQFVIPMAGPAIDSFSVVGDIEQSILEANTEAAADGLPAFSGRTSGILVPNEPPGAPVMLESGATTGARFPFSQADGHVETLGAQWMEENGVTDATLYHNNPKGTCGNCDYYLPTFLQEGSQMTVVPPADAVGPTARWITVPKTYTGNSGSAF